MSEGVYFIQYTGTGVVELGSAGVFQAQTAAFVSAEIAELARKHGDFIVEERQPPQVGPPPKAELEAAEQAQAVTESEKTSQAGTGEAAAGAAADDKKSAAAGQPEQAAGKGEKEAKAAGGSRNEKKEDKAGGEAKAEKKEESAGKK